MAYSDFIHIMCLTFHCICLNCWQNKYIWLCFVNVQSSMNGVDLSLIRRTLSSLCDARAVSFIYSQSPARINFVLYTAPVRQTHYTTTLNLAKLYKSR